MWYELKDMPKYGIGRKGGIGRLYKVRNSEGP